MDYSFRTDLNAQTLVDLLKVAHGHLNKDRNAVCRAVDLSEKTIVDWYNEISYAYAPFRAHYVLGKEIVDEKILTEFLVFADSRTNSHAIEFSVDFLNEIIEKLNDGKSLRKLLGSIDAQLIKNFRQNLDKFRKLVFDTKIIMLEDGVPKQKGDKNDARIITGWIKDLNKIRADIGRDAMNILKALECDNAMFNKMSNSSTKKRRN